MRPLMRFLIPVVLAFTASHYQVNCAALVARGSANFTTATTWGVSEAGAGAEQLTRSASTNTTTSYVYSSAFTCTNTDVVEGLLLRVNRINSTGTVSVALSDDNGVTATRSVTVNASDLTLTDPTWVFFKFGSTLTCDGGADYKVGVLGSSAGNATFYRDGTAGNWTRILRTATTRVPVAADSFYIAGEWTAAATVTALTVTLNETATTDYGLMDIGQNGTATAGTTAATNYYLRLSGDLNVWAGGTLSLGTVGTPVPSGSTFKLNLDCGSNVQYGLIVNNQSTFIAQGATKTIKAFLAADAAAAATSLTTDVSTGWLNGDEIAIAPTTRTASQSEKQTLGANATGTSIPTIGALTNAHSGTAPTRAELANLTRNVQVFGASASLQTYALINATATVDVDYAEFYWMGSNNGGKRGVNVEITTGSVSIQYASFHNFEVANSLGLYIPSLTSGSLTLSNNVMYLVSQQMVYLLATPNTGWVVSDNLFIRSTGSPTLQFEDIGGTITNNTVAGAGGAGIQLRENATLGVFSGNIAHSGNSYGFEIFQSPNGAFTLTASTAWRNSNIGIYFGERAQAPYTVTVDGYTAFGNGTANLQLQQVSNLVLNALTLNGDSTFATANGIDLGPGFTYPSVTLNNSVLGAASGILVGHSTGDIIIGSLSSVRVTGSNTTLASTNPVTGNTNQVSAFVGINKFGQVSGVNKAFIQATTNTYHIIITDSVIFKTAAPSARLIPISAFAKLQTSLKTVALNSGASTTVSVWVRKSVSTDAGGANYNGAQPRLMIQTNAAAGIGTGATDVVCATMTAAVGTWEQLSCATGVVSEDTVLALYVDLDGTAGWVNVDDWTVTNSQPTGAEKYWLNGGTQLTLPGSGSTAATIAYPMVQ